MTSKPMPQSIIQALFRIASYEYLLLETNNPIYQEKLDTERQKVEMMVVAWGGIQEVDQWLKEHDPLHSRIEDFHCLDLSWLSDKS